MTRTRWPTFEAHSTVRVRSTRGSFSEPAGRSIAERAGLAPFDAFEIDAPWSYPDHATALRALASPGGAVKAAELAGAAAVDRAHAEAIAPFRASDGSYRVETLFRCLFTRPAMSAR